MRSRALVLLPVLLLAGCGSDVDPAVKERYIADAEKICERAVAEQKKLPAPLGVADFQPYVTKTVAIVDRVFADLKALSPPEGDADELNEKVFTPLGEQLAVAKEYEAKVKAAVKAKNQPEIIALIGNPPTETKADLRFMKRYGFDICVKAADTSD